MSRWGRFQDADESAYYEYICKRAGIRIEYCAEQFENDGSPVSTIVKGVKRAMAGEYSRELSAKVFAGQNHSAASSSTILMGPELYSIHSDGAAHNSLVEKMHQRYIFIDPQRTLR